MKPYGMPCRLYTTVHVYMSSAFAAAAAFCSADEQNTMFCSRLIFLNFSNRGCVSVCALFVVLFVGSHRFFGNSINQKK